MMAMAVVIIASAELVATVPLGVRASIAMPVHVQSTSNVTVVTGANNVQGQVKWPTVKLLGVVDSFTLCEQLCYSAHRPQHRSGPQQEHDQEHSSSRSSHGQVASGRKDQAHALSVIEGGGPCMSFTYHHLDFVKPEYRGHCYEHTDTLWAPVQQPGDLAKTPLFDLLCCDAQHAFIYLNPFISFRVLHFHLCRG